jgi:hypothetical protein
LYPFGGKIFGRLLPAAGFLTVSSDVRVADGRKKPLIEGSLSDMQVARLFLFEVNDKNALCCGLLPQLPGDLRFNGERLSCEQSSSEDDCYGFIHRRDKFHIASVPANASALDGTVRIYRH